MFGVQQMSCSGGGHQDDVVFNRVQPMSCSVHSRVVLQWVGEAGADRSSCNDHERCI